MIAAALHPRFSGTSEKPRWRKAADLAGRSAAWLLQA